MSRRILIVDDQTGVQFALSDYFSQHGYEADCAGTSEEALTYLRTRKYVLVVSDLRLTGSESTEGLEIVRFVSDHCPGTVVVLLTGYLLPSVEVEARSRGAALVLDKSLGLFDIMPAVFRLLEQDGGSGHA